MEKLLNDYLNRDIEEGASPINVYSYEVNSHKVIVYYLDPDHRGMQKTEVVVWNLLIYLNNKIR